MPSVLRAVMFDFNGVLVDDEPIHLEMFQKVLGEEGIELGRDEYYETYLGFDDKGCFAAVLDAAGEPCPPARLARLIARKAAYYRQRVQDGGFPFFPGAAELVRDAADRGWTLGLVSGALRDEIDGALRQAGLRELFKVVVAAEDVEESKPSPEGYEKALSALNSAPPLPERLVHPHEVLALEDSPAGLESAAAAGLVSVGVAQTYPASELGAAGAVVERCGDLSAERLVELYDRLAER